MQIQSLQILSMSSEDLRSLLQKESEENPFLDYHPSASRGGAVSISSSRRKQTWCKNSL